MKKILTAAVLLLAGAFFAFAQYKEKISVKLAGGEREDKILVVATIFPQFDFARAVAGDRAEVALLLPPGTESHTYEPSPAEITRIGGARVFLYTGAGMEPWAERLTTGFKKGEKPLTVDVSQGVELLGGTHGYHAHESEAVISDPHIWTDPGNAMTMTKNILLAMVAVDPAGEAVYRENAKNYLAGLVSLDRDIKDAAAAAKKREIVLGGRNAMRYFLKRYGITAYSAFDSCSAGQEPSVKIMAELKDMIKKKEINAIYYEELSEPRTARALAEGTGAKLLLLHSLHNLSKEEFDAGETYISLMRRNLEYLKEGLI